MNGRPTCAGLKPSAHTPKCLKGTEHDGPHRQPLSAPEEGSTSSSPRPKRERVARKCRVRAVVRSPQDLSRVSQGVQLPGITTSVRLLFLTSHFSLLTSHNSSR